MITLCAGRGDTLCGCYGWPIGSRDAWIPQGHGWVALRVGDEWVKSGRGVLVLRWWWKDGRFCTTVNPELIL